jgi:hypothetical protein
MGQQGADAVQESPESVSKPAESITAMLVGGALPLIGANSFWNKSIFFLPDK